MFLIFIAKCHERRGGAAFGQLYSKNECSFFLCNFRAGSSDLSIDLGVLKIKESACHFVAKCYGGGGAIVDQLAPNT